MKIFSKAKEAQITRAILRKFANWLDNYVESDVIIVGGGPSGLIAARDLAKDGVKTLIIERNNYLGGGFWIGGYLMNTLTFRSPAETVLDELRIKHEEVEEGLFTASGPEACSKLIAAACDAGAQILNMTKFDDVVYRNKKVEGVVINWSAVSALPRQISCVDPVSLESKIVIDATGHDAFVVKSLEERGILKTKGCGAMDVEASEDGVVNMTGIAHPGLIVTGMAVSTLYGIPRMGPTFGGMLLSGQKAASEAKKVLSKEMTMA